MADKPAGTINHYAADLGKYERLHILSELIWSLEEWRQGRIKDPTDQLKLLNLCIETIEKLIAACEE